MQYNKILVNACAENGIAAFTGDGMDSNVMVAATQAIKEAGGAGVPTVKPWSKEMVADKMALVKDSSYTRNTTDHYCCLSHSSEPNERGIPTFACHRHGMECCRKPQPPHSWLFR